MGLIDELRWRGMLHDLTDGAEEAFAGEPRTAYIGFDPTASSLHVGTLQTIMGLVHLQRAGHHPIALVGGGTGMVGDPSGKSQERQLLTPDEIEENLDGIRGQLAHFLDFDSATNPARILNNLEWLGELGALEFLRDVGKHFGMNPLLRKDTVRRRLEDEAVGISYTEFSYILLQAYDFLALHDRHGCTVQMGGSDQWGNITAGIELIRKVRSTRAFGVVFPLVTQASGAKFGKTESGTIWLDPARTSPYRFYQFWLNTDDRDAVRWLRSFTLLDRDRIAEIEDGHAARPHERGAQHALAEDVTRRVHGDRGLASAQRATAVLFGGSPDGLSAEEIEEVFQDVPSADLDSATLEGEGMGLVELLRASGAVQSTSEARRAIQGGGVYLNGERVPDIEMRVTSGDALANRFLVLRLGKKRYVLVRLRQ